MTRVNLITGGAGFIGSNLAYGLLRAGERVVLYDNLSRKNVEQNANWLLRGFPGRAELVVADIRDRRKLRECVQRADCVFHLAAQVAVTTSLEEPWEDFEVNAGGTLNLLEVVRGCDTPPAVFYTSTNKVYGELGDLASAADDRAKGVLQAATLPSVDETRSLDFHSPYGCSKGTADQYVRDYARSYGLTTVVFRMSCIYGPRQFGTEDQGWVAHFLIRALHGETITIYGDGRQVRDVLFVSDLVNAFLLARENSKRCAGEVFNMGGGASNAVDLLQVVDWAKQLGARPAGIDFASTRVGDQRYYVSDTSKFSSFTGWRAEVDAQDGVRRLARWLRSESGHNQRELDTAVWAEAPR
ncbi:MAG: NAD-dependent epimerase/dehydratase family protein [Myxococcota bacterium]